MKTLVRAQRARALALGVGRFPGDTSMLRADEELLLDFCVKQRAAFEPKSWRQLHTRLGDAVAAAALFLANVDWYGRQHALREVAEQLHPGSKNFSALASQANFDCGRFSSMLKMRLDHASRLS